MARAARNCRRISAGDWNTLIGAYGLTETSPGATINPVTDGGYNGSIGSAHSSTEVRLRRDDGSWIALDDFESTGEICIPRSTGHGGLLQPPEETEKSP